MTTGIHPHVVNSEDNATPGSSILFSTSSTGLGEASVPVDQRGGAAATLSPSTSASLYLPAARSRLNSDRIQPADLSLGQETDSVDSHASGSSRVGLPTGLTLSRSASCGISHASNPYQALPLSEALRRTNGDVGQALEDAIDERNKFCQEASKLSSENVRIWNLMGRIRKENDSLRAKLSATNPGVNGGEGSKIASTASSASFMRSATTNGWIISSPPARSRYIIETSESDNNPPPHLHSKRPSSSSSSSEAHHPSILNSNFSIRTTSSSKAASPFPPTSSHSYDGRLAETYESASTGLTSVAPSCSIPVTVDTIHEVQDRVTSASGSPATRSVTAVGLTNEQEDSVAPNTFGSSSVEQGAAALVLQPSHQLNTKSTPGITNGERGAEASSSEDAFGPTQTDPNNQSNNPDSEAEYSVAERSSIGDNDSIIKGQSRISTPLRFSESSGDTAKSVPLASSTSAANPQEQSSRPPGQGTITPMRSIREIRSALQYSLAAADSQSAWTDDLSASPLYSSSKDLGGMLGGYSVFSRSSSSPTHLGQPSIDRKASFARLEPRDATTGSTFSLARALAEVASSGPSLGGKNVQPGGAANVQPGGAARGIPQPRLNNALLKQASVAIHGSNFRHNERAKETISFYLLVELSGPLPSTHPAKWMVEKLYSDVVGLDATLKHKHGKAAMRIMENCHLPDRILFKDHAPSKVDLRNAMLENYFESLLAIPLPDKDDYCTFLCTDAVPSPSKDPKTMTKEGFLTKKGQNLGRWVTRFYSLKSGDQLNFFEGKGGALLGSIDLKGAQIGKQQKSQISETDENSYRHAFLILERKGKTNGPNGPEGVGGQGPLIRHVLCAETDEERDDWVDVLVRAIDENDKASRATTPAPHPPSALPQGVSSSIQLSTPSEIQRPTHEASMTSQMRPSTSTEPIHTSFLTAPTPVAAVLPARASRSGSLSRKLGQRERSGSVGAEDNSKRSRDGHRNSSVAPELPITSDSSSAASARGQDLQTASPNSKERAARAGISGPMSGVPIPAGYKFGNRDENSAESTILNGKREDRKRFWHRFGGNASTPSTGAMGQTRSPVFGVALSQAIAVASISSGGDDNAVIPSVVFRCIDFLEKKGGLREEGIYRLSGSSTVVRALRDRFDTEGDVDLVREAEGQEKSSIRDPHAVAGLLKTYLRELPSSILTREAHLDFLRVNDIVDPVQRARELALLVSSLPLPNHALLKALIQHLTKVTNHQEFNKMTIRNVGIVFSPTLGIPAGLFALFLTTFNYCFGLGGTGPRGAGTGPRMIGAEEDASGDIMHTQVREAVAAAEEAGKVDEDPPPASTSRSNKRDSRMFSASEAAKLSEQMGMGSYAEGLEEEEEEKEEEEEEEGEASGRMTSSQSARGHDLDIENHTSEAFGQRTSYRPSENSRGPPHPAVLPCPSSRPNSAQVRSPNRSTSYGATGLVSSMSSGSANGNGGGALYAVSSRREGQRTKEEEDDGEAHPGVPRLTAARVSSGGESSGNILRKFRNTSGVAK